MDHCNTHESVQTPESSLGNIHCHQMVYDPTKNGAGDIACRDFLGTLTCYDTTNMIWRPVFGRCAPAEEPTHVHLPCCYEDCRDLHQGTCFADNNTRLHTRGLARLCSLHALQPVIIKTEPFWNSPPGEALARTRRRVAQSISFGIRRPSAGFIWTWRPPFSSHPREGSQRRPTRCRMAALSRPHHQWIHPHFRSVPKVFKCSLLHANTKQRDTRRLQAPKR